MLVAGLAGLVVVVTWLRTLVVDAGCGSLCVCHLRLSMLFVFCACQVLSCGVQLHGCVCVLFTVVIEFVGVLFRLLNNARVTGSTICAPSYLHYDADDDDDGDDDDDDDDDENDDGDDGDVLFNMLLPFVLVS